MAMAHGFILTGLLAGPNSPPKPNETALVEIVNIPAPEPPSEPVSPDHVADLISSGEAAMIPEDPAPAEPAAPETAPAQVSPTPVDNPDPPPLPPAAELPNEPEPPPKPVKFRAAHSKPPARTNNPTSAAAAPERPDTSDDASRETQATDSLRSRIRDAVQAAVRCPATARMMGLSGKAGVAFDYHDGAMTGAATLARTSGTPVLDTAALNAVRNAHYPAAPPEAAAQVLHLLIWVEEACGG